LGFEQKKALTQLIANLGKRMRVNIVN
jgi:hypothetical protein